MDHKQGFVLGILKCFREGKEMVCLFRFLHEEAMLYQLVFQLKKISILEVV